MPEEKCILDPNLDCIGKAAAALLEKRVTDLEEDQKKQAAFREAYYAEQKARIKRDAELEAKISSMDEKLDKLVSWQEGQQSAPKKRWDAILDKTIWAVLAAVIAFVLAKIGL